jgi:hypothetical protein
MVVLIFIELAFSRTGTGRQSSGETALLEISARRRRIVRVNRITSTAPCWWLSLSPEQGACIQSARRIQLYPLQAVP